MEALFELCDVIIQSPTQLADKLEWICDRCPQSELLRSGSPLVSLSHLNAVLAVARFLSKCVNCEDDRPKHIILEFLSAIPSSFDLSFWPQSTNVDYVSSFFIEFLGYVSKAAELVPEFGKDVSGVIGGVVTRAINCNENVHLAVSKAFLFALTKNFVPILPSDGEKLVILLLEQVPAGMPCPASPTKHAFLNSEASSSNGSPLNHVNYNPNSNGEIVNKMNDHSYISGSVGASLGSSTAMMVNGSNAMLRSGMDPTGLNFGYLDRGSCGDWVKQQVASLEEERVEELEKLHITFKLILHLLEYGTMSNELLVQVRILAKKQLQSLSAFLKIRKREWNEQGLSLKERVVAKLSVYQVAARMNVLALASLEADGKTSKKLGIETLALMIDAAEACLFSVWRRLKACEHLFSTLLSGIVEIAVSKGGQPLRLLLIHLKPIVLKICAQADSCTGSQCSMFEIVVKTCCKMVESCWTKEQAPVETFILGLTTSIRECNDFDCQREKSKQTVSTLQLNIITLLADMVVFVNKSEVVDMILPLFIESLEEGEASSSGLLRLRLVDAVSRIASLGFEKSYRETVVLMTRSYLSKISSAEYIILSSEVSEATPEHVETLPAGFLLIASGLGNLKLRSDLRYRLLSLCSDVGLVAESKSGRSGADFMGPLLPAIAEICSDFDSTVDMEPAILKLFRNLWFYVALFGLAPPIQTMPLSAGKSFSCTLNSMGSMGEIALQAVSGPYMWNPQWSSAVQQIALRTPPLVVSSVKWLEDELELNALHNPGSRRGIGNEKAAVTQRAALSAALGGRVEVAAMSTISGVKATYLLAVAFLEMIRFSSNGGMLTGGSTPIASRSAFFCVFEYLKTSNLSPAVCQCLTAIVHKAFDTAVLWLEDQMTATGNEAELRESAIVTHACFLIESLAQRDQNVRNIAVALLAQLRDKFPQVLWNSSCLDALLFSFRDDSSSTVVNDPAWLVLVRALYQKTVREWISLSLSFAPCTSQGLLQEKLCKANAWQRAQQTTDIISLLTEMQIGAVKSEWASLCPANIPAVLVAAAAASGANMKLADASNLEVLSTGLVNATIKCNHVGEIAGMRRLYNSIGGFQAASAPSGIGGGFQRLISGTFSAPADNDAFNKILLNKFVHLLQQFVAMAEKGREVDKTQFRETCSQATALLLASLGADSTSNIEGFSQLLRLLCWSPAYVCTRDVMETGVFVWTWLVSAAPRLGPVVLAELVDAWLWTMDTKRGIFACDVMCAGPSSKLMPQLAHGEPNSPPEVDPVEQIMAHRLLVGFFLDRFEVVRHNSIEQLLLLGRLLQGTMKLPLMFSHHPAATGTFFTLMLLGLKFCSHHSHGSMRDFKMVLQLLEDRIYRVCLGWFAFEPEWFELNSSFAQSEALSVSIFVHYLSNERGLGDAPPDLKGTTQENRNSSNDPIENSLQGREKRKQLLVLLCQHEADRLEVWTQPINSKENISRPKVSADKWIELAKSAFSVDPRIAFSLVSRFRSNYFLRTEVTQLVQSHILEIRCIPQALPFFVTPNAVEEDSMLLQQLPHWAPCSITQALEFLAPVYKGHPRVMAYVLRVLESYPPERVTFFMPQLVQVLRYDDNRLVEGYLLRAAQRSDVFAHILIWHLQGETCVPDSGKDVISSKNTSFQMLLPIVRQRIIDCFTPNALNLFQREFDFFDQVTSISGVLLPLPKEERRAGIHRELEKIEMQGCDLYLPTAPNKLVRGIRVDSGIPLQSAAKVPIMVTFDVVDRDGDLNEIKPQACIFKVGDDCRQDVLALQVISLLRDIFEAVGLNLYLFPYGVLPTGAERGIIEVVPNSRSRSQMGETTDGGLYEIFQQDFGTVGSPSFEGARENFITSSAGYAVASLLLQPKDRHNGNLLFDNVGRLVHIDFGFILETSPGGNMRFESAHFKLSHEMTQLLDPSGVMKSKTWFQFVSLCVKGYLAARRHMDGIVNTVMLMLDSGLPCFSRGDPIGNLQKRFHPEMTEREAANFMMRVCADAYNKWTTAGYDLIQYLQQGIEK